MLNSVCGLNIWLCPSLLQLNVDWNLAPGTFAAKNLDLVVYNLETKGKNAKLEHYVRL